MNNQEVVLGHITKIKAQDHIQTSPGRILPDILKKYREVHKFQNKDGIRTRECIRTLEEDIMIQDIVSQLINDTMIREVNMVTTVHDLKCIQARVIQIDLHRENIRNAVNIRIQGSSTPTSTDIGVPHLQVRDNKAILGIPIPILK